MELKKIKTEELEPSEHSIRETFGDIESLGDDIEDKGLLEPIIARPKGRDSYEIIAGERRWRAAKKKNIEELSVIVKDMDDKDSIYALVSENLYREDMKPHEMGKICKTLQVSYGVDLEEISEKFGKSKQTLKRYIEAYENFEDTTKKLIEEDKISTSKAEYIHKKMRNRTSKTREKTVKAQAKYDLPRKAFEKAVRESQKRKNPDKTFKKIKKRLERKKEVEDKEVIKPKRNHSNLHHSIKTAMYQWLDRNNYGVKSEIGSKGKRIPDLTGIKGDKTMFIEAETLPNIFQKKELPNLENRNIKKIIAIPNKIKERADEIWLVDSDTRSVEKKVKL